jgi:aspartate dehydrogenase
MTLEFALIGYGAIARYALKMLRPDEPARCTAIVMRRARVAEVEKAVGDGITVVGSVAELGFHVPPLVIEAAGHGGLAEHGAAVLEAGSDLVVVSVGALADHALYDRLVAAADKGKSKLLIVAGAVGGVDALAAARQGGLDRVRYISRKPPRAWKGTPAEKVADLAKLSAETQLFAGRADEAARAYPQNANVCATIALAGAGWDKTVVTLIADPAAEGNIHQIEAEGAFGRMTVEMRGKPLPDNPKTSSLAALSVLRAIRNRANAVEI